MRSVGQGVQTRAEKGLLAEAKGAVGIARKIDKKGAGTIRGKNKRPIDNTGKRN